MSILRKLAKGALTVGGGLIAGPAGAVAANKIGGAVIGSGGKKAPDPNLTQADDWLSRFGGIERDLMGYGEQFRGAGGRAMGEAERLASFDPWQGFEDEIGSITKGLLPGFQEHMQGLRESGNSRGAFRGGQQIFDENRAQAGFEGQVARAIAERGTARAGLDLQGRQASTSAFTGLSDRYAGALEGRSQLAGGMADYYTERYNADEERKGARNAGWMNLFGQLGGAAATAYAGR